MIEQGSHPAEPGLGAAADSAVIVEDDALISGELSELCAEFGVRVLAVRRHAAGAFDAILEHRPDFVLMDVRLAGKADGVDVAHAVFEAGLDSRIIYITASAEPDTMRRIKADHPYRILVKPIRPRDLRNAFLS